MMTQEHDLEDPLAIVTRLNADDGAALIAALTDDEAQTLVDRLKAGADKYWAINPNRSLEMADTIIKIADGRDNLSHKALGMMARGDALKLLGRNEEAWQELEKAATIYKSINDEVGWARTRIGYLYLCTSLNKVIEALADGELARVTFTNYANNALLLRLNINTAHVYFTLGDHQKALYWYSSSLSIAETLDFTEQKFISLVYLSIGAVYNMLIGDLKRASSYYHLALDFAIAENETKTIALAKHNLAYLALEQGQYSLALQLFYEVLDLCNTERFPFDANHINKLIVECYLFLNRFSEARELAIEVVDQFKMYDANYDEAYTILHLASVEVELMHLEDAEKALREAERLFTDLGANTWVAITHLRQGYLAFKQGDIDRALSISRETVDFFKASDQRVNLGRAMLLQAQVEVVHGDLENARRVTTDVLNIAHHARIPSLSYGSHLLLGHIAEVQGDHIRAARRYYAAIVSIARVQQGLTITLRPGFLEDKGDALISLIALYLGIEDYEKAFNVLERAKSQAFFNYIANQHLLRWSQNDLKSQLLIQELDQLRGEHHWWYQKAHIEAEDEQINKDTVSFEGALKEIANRERRMRSITEQLYLQSSATSTLLPSSTPQLQDIQGSLDEQTLLIEFYHDDKGVWIFTIDATICKVYRSPASVPIIEHDLNFLHFNIDTTLSAGAKIAQIPTLTKQTQYLLQRLYDQLLAPITLRLYRYQRLIFVPYGSLHYVPFHLLFSEGSYLIEHHEIIVLPAAGYVTRIGPSRIDGAKVIAHSLHGELPHAISEAHFVHDLFGGTVYIEDNASRSALHETPTQILHIATHAEYRQHQPDLSYIELADGHLFTDDLFQQDMSYELVTLSACETGRSHVASSDELIGLGRGFLYAGAGALVTSLWRVIDDVTPRLMEYFYRELHAGTSKAAALRAAQLAILRENPQMHPAYWGAFQLVGDPRPLSSNSGAKPPQ